MKTQFSGMAVALAITLGVFAITNPTVSAERAYIMVACVSVQAIVAAILANAWRDK